MVKKFLIKRIIMKFIKNMLMNIIVLLQWVFIIYNINLDSIYYIDVYMGRFLQNGQRSYSRY